MMFHRQPSLPVDSELLPSLECDETDSDTFIEKMTNVCEAIKETASRNISKAQSEQKKYYDSRHSTEVTVKPCMGPRNIGPAEGMHATILT